MKELKDFLSQNHVHFEVEPPKEQMKAAIKKHRMQMRGVGYQDEASDDEYNYSKFFYT